MQKATSVTPVTWVRPPAKVTSAQRKARRQKREDWLKQIDPAQHFHRLFDLIPGVRFFAKNRAGELMYLSASHREVYQIPDEEDVIGLSDFDITPPLVAEPILADDAIIYKTGKPLLNQVKLGFDSQGMPDWFIINKLPLRSRTGKIIGIMGFSQNYEGRARLLHPFHGIAQAVEHIRTHYAREITVAELAKLCSLSPRQLERRFKAAFGVGPKRFLIKTRLHAACRALRDTDSNVAEIAAACGFTDQSAFARQFRQAIGTTPREFRLRSLR